MNKKNQVGNSKLPLVHQLPIIAENLKNKFNKAACVEVKCWDFNIEQGPKLSYSLYIEHFTHAEDFKSWPELLTFYRSLMNKES